MKQRYNECALASVCILTGNDYETASDLFQELHGMSWWQAIVSGGSRWHKDFLAYIAPRLDQKPLFYGTWVTLSNPDLSGKGIVIIRHKSGVGHGMAFADGIVVDTNTDTYATLAEILAQEIYAGFYVESIARESDTTQ